MSDPRIEQYAKLLVETCVDVQPGWQVLVNGGILARPLLEAVSREVARRGAYALQRPSLGGQGINLPWALEAPDELLEQPSEIDAYTFPVGEVSPDAERLLEGCQAALAAGIEQCRVGNRLSDISHAVQTVVERNGLSVVRSLVGHGVGRAMHEEPQIPNFGEPGRGPLLAEGMTFAIEPMINAGTPDVVLHEDQWSISTEDGSLSAHFEHTVAITEEGPRILTAATTAVRA